MKKNASCRDLESKIIPTQPIFFQGKNLGQSKVEEMRINEKKTKNINLARS